MDDEWDETDETAAVMEAGLQQNKIRIEVLGQWISLRDAEQLAHEILAKVKLADETAKRQPPDVG